MKCLPYWSGMIQTLFLFSEWIKCYRPLEMVCLLLGSLTWSSASLWPVWGSNQVLAITLPPFFHGVDWGEGRRGSRNRRALVTRWIAGFGFCLHAIRLFHQMWVRFSFIFPVTEQQDTIITGTWENKCFILSVCSEKRPISCWQPLPCRLILGTSKGISTMENTLSQRLTSHLG